MARNAILNDEDWRCFRNHEKPSKVYSLLAESGFADVIQTPDFSQLVGSKREDKPGEWSSKILGPQQLEQSLGDLSAVYLLSASPLGRLATVDAG
jgi:hypothetical protein